MKPVNSLLRSGTATLMSLLMIFCLPALMVAQNHSFQHLQHSHNNGETPTMRNCHAMDVLDSYIQRDPAIQLRMQEIERHTQAYVNNPPNERVTGVIKIPVVVHIIYKASAENISDAQIQSQLTVLNQDFRRTNADRTTQWSQAADTEIEFCLATVDPNGAATTGITRTATSVTSFSTNDAMKYTAQGGKDAWNTSKYLNIWVCNIGGGILGYAQFPGGGSAATDGVVVGYNYFGTMGTAVAPFNKGRTATHEVGHWLNLRHIWGDGGCSVDDLVSDTPVSDAANYGCATGHVSCSTVDMVQNYMDYSDDACMNLFTAGQKARMRALFATGGARVGLLTSNGCGTTAPPPSSCTSTISTFPYTEGFETGFGAWVQSTADNFDWTRQSGGTPTANTGPSAAAAGSFYIFTESSSPNSPSKVAIINSPCFNLTNISYPEFNFKYNMNGTSMGTLALEGSLDGTTWTTLWTMSGNKGTAWLSAKVVLTAYANKANVRLRFKGTTGSSYLGDAAIDDISLVNNAPGGCNNNLVTLVLNFDNYPAESSWAIKNSAGTTVASGANYTGTTKTETACLTTGCYSFIMYDSYGDGMCCTYGNGSYRLTNSAGAVLASGGSFGASQTTNFCVGGATARDAGPASTPISSPQVEEEIQAGLFSINLFPNPTSNILNIDIESSSTSVRGQIMDATGRTIWSDEMNIGSNNINVRDLPAGIYHFTAIQADGKVTSRKFVKTTY